MAKEDLADRLVEILERNAKAQEAILDRIAQFTPAERSDPALTALTDGLHALAEAQKQIATNQDATLKQIHRPQNQFPPLISVFNPRGDKDFPRPALKCGVFPFAALPGDADMMTREEIELHNALIDAGDWSYPLRLSDGTQATLEVRLEYVLGTKTPMRCVISHPQLFKFENKDKIPDGWIRRMLMGRKDTKAKAAAIVTMDEEVALIEAGRLNDDTVPENGFVVSVGA